MYEAHFGLTANPFGSTLSPEFIYQGREHQEALAHFEYALTNLEAFVLLTGEVGIGKSTAIQALTRRLRPEHPLAVMSHTTLAPREFLDAVMLRFGLETRPEEGKPILLDRLERYLVDRRRAGVRALLVVDEAHLLRPEVLEEVRLLSNLEREGEKLLQIVLVGQPELEAYMQRPELRQLRQRISVRYTLKPLTREETVEYIHHRLRAAGAENPAALFPEDAANAVHMLSGGLPREINVVAGQSLLAAYLEEAKAVTRRHVFGTTKDFGFQGIVTGPEGLKPDVIPHFTPGPRTRRVPTPRSEDVSEPPPSSTRSRPGAPPSRPIPLPPASLRLRPLEPARASEPARAADAEPPPAQTPAPATRMREGPGTVPSPDDGRRSPWSIVVLLLVLAVIIVGAAWVWRSGERRRAPAERSDTSAAENTGALPTENSERPPAQDTGPAADTNIEPGAGANTDAPTAQDTEVTTPMIDTGDQVTSTPAPSEAPPEDATLTVSAPNEPRLAVQIASFRTRGRAVAVLDEMTRATGQPGVVVTSDGESGAAWHGILLGAFTDPAQARAFADSLLAAGTISEVVLRPLAGAAVSAAP